MGARMDNTLWPVPKINKLWIFPKTKCVSQSNELTPNPYIPCVLDNKEQWRKSFKLYKTFSRLVTDVLP